MLSQVNGPVVLKSLDTPVSLRISTFVPFVYRDKFRGEKIPTLEEAVEECIRLQLIIYFDVKGHPDEVKTTKQAKQELDMSNS